MKVVRSAVALAVVATVGASLSACGGGDEAGPAPSSATASPSPSQRATTSPSPTASSTPTLAPLSAFEGRPPVKAARQMAIRLGRAVNKGDRSMATLGQAASAAGKRNLAKLSGSDFGSYFPGPQPFTPVAVKAVNNTAVITACWWSLGWTQDRKTDLPKDKRRIDPARILLTRTNAGQWQVDDVVFGKNNCSNVNVKGRPW